MNEGASWTPLDHTADIGFTVTAPGPEPALETAARALMSLLADPEGIVPRQTRHVTLRAGDPAELLVRWLAEILSLHATEGFLFCDFRVDRFEGRLLEATLSGEPFDPSRHTIRAEIKAVTYHQASFGIEGGRWKGRVILDV